jgi:hypothetical protein
MRKKKDKNNDKGDGGLINLTLSLPPSSLFNISHMFLYDFQ